jgi:hypothetical protein
LVKPAAEWKAIHREPNDLNDVLSGYSLPLIGLCTLSTFISILVNLQEINFEIALKHALITFTALFGGLYLAYLLLNRFLPGFQVVHSKTLSFKLIAYSSTPLLVITFFVNLFPELILLYLASVYTYFVVWHGIKELPRIKAESVLTLGILISLLIHLLPFLIQRLLLKLIFI